MRRFLMIAALLTIAGVCGFLAYTSLSPRPRPPDRWAQAAALAHRAEKTKGELPAIQARDDAANLFLEVARSGPVETRSRATMLAGLLRLRNVSANAAKSGQSLVDIAAFLRHAVRLDRQNDDAAYDLELLLAQGRASGHPIPQSSGPRTRREGSGVPDIGKPGGGY